MIFVTRINGKQFVINSDLIETVEETPDTVITLTNGRKMVVIEKPEDIVQRVIQFKSRVCQSSLSYEHGSREEEK